jgi:hypothetical protein
MTIGYLIMFCSNDYANVFIGLFCLCCMYISVMNMYVTVHCRMYFYVLISFRVVSEQLG